MPRVEIYTTPWCAHCIAAKRLLGRKGVSFEETDVSESSDLRREMMKRTGGRHSVPQIFIGGTSIGGSDEIHALDRSGKLDLLLAGSA